MQTEDTAQQALPQRTLPSTRKANWALVLLFLTIAINILDRQIVNILAESIKTDLQISDAQLGLLTGTAFGILYSVLGIPLGRLADRMDRVRLISLALLIWSTFTVISGMARNFVQLGLARIGVGVGEAACVPASVALVSDLFPEKRATSAISLMMLGVPAGTFTGLLFGGLIGSEFGWRVALVLAGLPGLVLALIFVTTVRDPRTGWLAAAGARSGGSGGAGEQSFLGALTTLIKRPGYPILVIGVTCSILLAAVMGAWLPVFFIRVHGLSVAEMGGYAAICFGIGGGIGTLGSGVLCDALRPRIREVEAKVLIASLLLSVPALLLTLFSPDAYIALVGMFLLNVFIFSYLAPSSTLLQRAATPDTRSLAIGGAISFGNILSLGLVIALIGALSDALTPLYGERAIQYALAVCMGVGIIGAFAHWRAAIALRRAA